MPDGFGVAVVREDGKWRCSAMRRAALNSLTAAETELRELRSAGAVFGLLDVDDEFFVIVRPAPAGTRLLLSDATAALDYDIAAEVLEKLDNDISSEELEDADLPDGFGVAVVREDGKWRCTPMRPAALTSLAAAETELRELRSAGAVFGLLDVDDEFFVIVRPAPAGTRLLLSDATAALDYDIAAEVLEMLDADIGPDDLDDADPFEEGDLGLLADVGLPEAVLGVIISELDLYADEQLGRIAREMGFAEELSAVLDRLDR